jgi:hypothetical protein
MRTLGRIIVRAVTVTLSTLGRIARAMSNQASGPDPVSDVPSKPTDYRP